MVNNVVNATYVETYDLRTTVGKMTILGVHTPTAPSLKKMYKGFFEQYKKIKINSCDIVGVCASTQSLTPSEVGLEAGKVSPREILDPILFSAMTGENLNLLLDKIYGSAGSENGSVHSLELSDSANAQRDAYYTMLADDRFRKFHPQGGIRVGNLKPFVHRVATTQPFKWEVGATPNRPAVGNVSSENANTDNANAAGFGFGSSNGGIGANPSVFISNGLEPMPWIETTYEGSEVYEDETSGTANYISTILAANIPRCYCGVIVLPPAEYTSLYFRFSIRWHVSFKDFRPAYEIGPIGVQTGYEDKGMSSSGLYFNLYNVSKMLDKEFGSFDVNGADSVEETFSTAH